jgi:putative membrane protein
MSTCVSPRSAISHGAVAVLFVGVWPAAVLAHSGAGGMAQAPVWFTQVLYLLVWFTYAVGASRRCPASGPRLALHSAMLIAGLALFGPLDEWSEQSAAWHMVQHMLLMVVVAPLLVLARPLPQWRAVWGARADAAWRTLHRLSRRPMACALLHAAAIWFWHAPGPYIAALASPLWHVLEHAWFGLSGWLFWWSVLRPSRTGALPAAGALLFTVMHTGLLGALLAFAHQPLYSEAPRALADQQLAGLVMWVPGGLVYLLALVWAAMRWLAWMEEPAQRGTGKAGTASEDVAAVVAGADTRQITLPTSSATSKAPWPSMATPTGRPRALPSSSRKPVSTSTGGPLGCAPEKGT